MINPLEGIRQFYDYNVRPIVDDVVDTATDVADAASDVGSAVADAAGDVKDAVQKEGVANVVLNVLRHDAAQAGNILNALRTRSPQDFVNWLIGPDGPSLADQTALIPGLQQAIGDVLHTSMQNPLIAGAVGRAFGFEYVPGQDFYTTNENSVQSMFGFHDMYDKVGDLLGMDLEDKVKTFEVDGVEYRLEMWKGSYGSGGAYGGEIGLYTNGAGDRGPPGDLLERIPGYYSAAAGENQIRMTQEIYDNRNGETQFRNVHEGADQPDGRHYWNLAIRTDPGFEHENIGQRGTLECNTPEFAQKIYDALKADNEFKNVELSADGRTVTYDWP